MGLLQRALSDHRRRNEEEQRLREQAVKGLERYAEIGDDVVKGIAETGILEYLAKPDKYKGTHLQQIQQYLQQHPDRAAAPSEFGGPPLEDISRPASFEGQPAPAAPVSAPPPTAGMPDTNMTQQPGQAVGTSAVPPPGAPAPAAPAAPAAAPPAQPPVSSGPPVSPVSQPPAAAATPAPLFSATTPDSLGAEAAALFAGAGVGMPQAPDTAAIAEEIARQYGYTTAELSDPNFVYSGGLLNPRRVKDQQDYRTRLAQATQTAETEYRMSSSNYAAGVRAYMGQVGSAARTASITSAAAARQEDAQRESQTRFDRSQAASAARAEKSGDRAADRQARAAWASEVATAERQIRAMRADPSASIKEKMQPGIFDRMLAEAKQAADDRYRAVTGQEPPSVGGPGGRPTPQPATAPPPGTSRPGNNPPPAAPAASTASGAPPAAPIGPDDEKRAAMLVAKIGRQGREALSAEERAFMADYTARKTSRGNTGNTGNTPLAARAPQSDPGYIPRGPF